MASLLPPVSTAFVVVVKRAAKPMYDENDQSLISCLGALRLGFEARIREEATDQARADELWASAKAALEREEEDSVGVEGQVQVADDYNMACVGFGL